MNVRIDANTCVDADGLKVELWAKGTVEEAEERSR